MTRLAGQLMSNEAFVSALQGAIARAMDAKLVLDNQMRAALARLGVSTQRELEDLRSELNALNAEVQSLRQETERLRSELPAQTARTKAPVSAAERMKKNGAEVSAG